MARAANSSTWQTRRARAAASDFLQHPKRALQTPAAPSTTRAWAAAARLTRRRVYGRRAVARCGRGAAATTHTAAAEHLQHDVAESRRRRRRLRFCRRRRRRRQRRRVQLCGENIVEGTEGSEALCGEVEREALPVGAPRAAARREVEQSAERLRFRATAAQRRRPCRRRQRRRRRGALRVRQHTRQFGARESRRATYASSADSRNDERQRRCERSWQ